MVSKGADTDARYDEAINNAFLETERELTQMPENARKTYLKSIEKTPFRMAFDDSGKYIGAKADNVNSEAVTNNLRSLTGNLNYAPVKADTELNADALEGKRVVEDIFGKDNASVVISDSMNEYTRATVDIRTGVIYINNNMEFDESFSSTVAAIHEIVHTTEGTAEYHELVETLKEAIVVSDVHKMLEGKDFSVADGEELTDEKQKYIVSTELNADLVGHLLSTPGALARLRARNKNIFNRLKAFMESARDNSTSKEGKKALNKVLKSFDKALDASNGGVLLSNLRDDEEKENTEQEHGVGDERNSKITADMTDAERYEILKHKEIQNIPVVESIPAHVLDNISEISSWDDLNNYFGKSKKNLIQRIAKEFDVIGHKYYNDDINVSFSFSGHNFNESYKKQGKNFVDFARMFYAFDSIIENAIGVEIHNRTDYKIDPTLNNVFVLMSVYEHGDFLTPVKLEVKEFRDKQNTLYVAISLDKIKKAELYARGDTENGVTQRTRSTTISISKLFEKINPSDKSFIKYIPDGFLTKTQLQSKKEAIEEDRIKTEKLKASEKERNSKKAEGRGVTWSDLEPDITVQEHGVGDERYSAKINEINNVMEPSTENDNSNNEKNTISYEIALEQIDDETFDVQANTHLTLLDSTPQIYIEKAGAGNREILMKWDIAYLAMKKSGTIPGNYHGLGLDVMKMLPNALEDPLYIIKQKNGRIAAITKIVVKGKRAVFASIELEAFQTIKQNGITKAENYNIILTVTDAKPNYLQNTIFDGDVVYNKNNEEPAHFILRLKSLNKALPTYDRASSSIDSIPENSGNVNTNERKSKIAPYGKPKNLWKKKDFIEFVEKEGNIEFSKDKHEAEIRRQR